MKAILEFEIETNEGRQRFLDSLNGPDLRAAMLRAVEIIQCEMLKRPTPEVRDALQYAILRIVECADSANVDLYA